MARELGLNPKKFGKLAKHEPWKAPLPVFIENIYYKRFKKPRPDRVLSIEQLFKERKKKKADRKSRKRMQKQNGFVSESNQTMVKIYHLYQS